MRKITPVFIASPVRRSGTTLLQRLLSSAPNTLIYGESCVHDLIFYTNLYNSKKMVLANGKEWRDEQLSAVLAGETADWIPDLMPNIDGYVEAVRQLSFSMMDHYQSFAEQHNRPVWGAKFPEWNVQNLHQIHQLMPNCKIIYLVRDLADCLRSAKSMDMVRDLEEAIIFCQTWKQNRDYALQYLTGERILHLNYEKLIAKPKKTIKLLEHFTNAEGIKKSVFKKKINTYLDKERAIAVSYLKPAKLSEEELALVERLMSG